MPLFEKIPTKVEAHQWFKNGDHPDDQCPTFQRPTGPNGEMFDYPGEGRVVRYFRRPDVDGGLACRHCGVRMHDHGWVDTLEGGHIVCPGDWILTGIKGERYPCKPDIFAATYRRLPDPDLEAPPDRRSPKTIWVYTVNSKGLVTHERSFPGDCAREARARVGVLLSRGQCAFVSETFIKDAYA